MNSAMNSSIVLKLLLDCVVKQRDELKNMVTEAKYGNLLLRNKSTVS